MPERLPPRPATTAGQFDLFGKRVDGPRVYSVSELTRELKAVLEGRFPSVLVKGEVSNLKTPSSGHLYFTLKDADACLEAVLFRTEARRLRFSVQNGLSLVARGRLAVYEPQGRYQLVCDTVVVRMYWRSSLRQLSSTPPNARSRPARSSSSPPSSAMLSPFSRSRVSA